MYNNQLLFFKTAITSLKRTMEKYFPVTITTKSVVCQKPGNESISRWREWSTMSDEAGSELRWRLKIDHPVIWKPFVISLSTWESNRSKNQLVSVLARSEVFEEVHIGYIFFLSLWFKASREVSQKLEGNRVTRGFLWACVFSREKFQHTCPWR